jgi:hypothetical protein
MQLARKGVSRSESVRWTLVGNVAAVKIDLHVSTFVPSIVWFLIYISLVSLRLVRLVF